MLFDSCPTIQKIFGVISILKLFAYKCYQHTKGSMLILCLVLTIL